MAKAKLTKRFIDAVQTTGEKDYFDTELTGFCLRISRSGTRSFGVMYRNRGGQKRRYSIGLYGVLTPEQARAEARQLLSRVERGEDPASESKAHREAWTLRDLAKFFRETRMKELRQRTHDEYESQIDRFILPALGNRKVSEVTTPDVTRLHRDISKQGRTQANRVIACLSSMFGAAIGDGHRGDNPCRGVRKHPEKRNERWLSEDELGRLLVACDAHQNQQAANLLRLLALTGARKAEALTATWDMFDLDRGVWTKPSHHTKQKRLHRTPLVEAATALLTSMQAEADPECPWVFPGRDSMQPLREPKRPVAQIMTAAGFSDVTFHVLRHTFASQLVLSGTEPSVAGKMLGHTQANTTARYVHLADSPLREAATRFDGIAARAKTKALEKQKADAAKVVSIDRARR